MADKVLLDVLRLIVPSQRYETLNNEDLAEVESQKKRPQSSNIKSAYIRRLQSSRGTQVSRKLNFHND